MTSESMNTGADLAGPLETVDWRTYPILSLPRILDAALTEIVQHRYDATSVRSIASKVGCTVPALYYHFENKQAILVGLLDIDMDIVIGHVEAAR